MRQERGITTKRSALTQTTRVSYCQELKRLGIDKEKWFRIQETDKPSLVIMFGTIIEAHHRYPKMS